MSTTLDTIDDGGVNIVEFSYFSARGTCVLDGSPQKETSVWTKWLQSGCSHLVVCQGPHATSSTNQHFRVYRYGTNINMICIKTQHTQHLLNKPTEIQPPYRLTSDQNFFLCPFKWKMTKQIQSVCKWQQSRLILSRGAKPANIVKSMSTTNSSAQFSASTHPLHIQVLITRDQERSAPKQIDLPHMFYKSKTVTYQ